MQLAAWMRPRIILKEKGVILGLINLALAFVCAVTFFGAIAGTFVVSGLLQSYTGNPRLLVPVPVPVLLLAYVVAFLLTWVSFARRLPPRPLSRAIWTGLLGATPLFGLSLLGYMSVAWMLVTGDFGPNSMLEASVVIYSVLSTLILLAGATCMVTVTLSSPRSHH